MSDQKNLILAILLSMVVLFGFEYLINSPRKEALRQQQEQMEEIAAAAAENPLSGPTGIGGADDLVLPQTMAPATLSLEEALIRDERRLIETPAVHGSIRLKGGRVDDLVLKRYAVELGGEERVRLLAPREAEGGYYADFGWITPPDANLPVPGSQTEWTAPENAVLTPETPLVLEWDNGHGLTFQRIFEIDSDYMITVTEEVENHTKEPVSLIPYGIITREGTPQTTGFFILHEGPIGVFDRTLKEIDYDDLSKKRGETIIANRAYRKETTGGWLGFTDKYWLVSLIPNQTETVTAQLFDKSALPTDSFRRYQADYAYPPQMIPAGDRLSISNRLFAGAKKVRLLNSYEKELEIDLFSSAIDWGIFFFLTRPFFWALDFFAGILGSFGIVVNFGLAILALTVLIKLFFFPLQNKAYKSMSMMKKLQPEMMEMRERFQDDPQRMQQEVMALYKREKVNPLSGCLPILIQIPVFFALYKVLFISIEMRHAPFWGWVQDLSAPDPTSVLNLFGLLPWGSGPSILAIGAWPILMGLTMWMQTKLNPAPPDKAQAMFLNILPIFFTFLLAGFPAGLVIYWVWNNILSILQQYIIMRRMGVPIGGEKEEEETAKANG